MVGSLRKFPLLRAWRLGAVALFAWLLAQRPIPPPANLSLAQAQQFFPAATQLQGETVLDAAGVPLGKLLFTLPQSQSIKGYRGPSQTLLAIDPQDRLVGWKLLDSPDTQEHVAKVLADPDFPQILAGWHPSAALPRIDGVSGATLTSLAIAEGIVNRLSDTKMALKFPEPISVLETRRLFPRAATLRKVGPKVQVLDADAVALGWVLTSTPESQFISGYQGPTDLLISLSLDESTVLGVRLRRSYDNEEYVSRLKEDPNFLASFANRPVADLAQLDFAHAAVQGVSGATLTSFAVAASLHQKFQPPPPPIESRPSSRWSWKEAAIAAFALGGCLMGYSKLRGVAWLRWAWQAAVVAGLGFGLGAPLSIHYFAGWLEHGWNFAAPGLLVLGLVALLAPWATGKQIYCHQLCPHGQLQLWFTKWSPWQLTVPKALHRYLQHLPALLLGAALLSLILSWGWNLVLLEPFDAWVPAIAAPISLALAILGLLASLAVPQAYCKYGCPTGALLKWTRHLGTTDRWSHRDTAAVLLLLLAAAAAKFPLFT